MSNSTEPAVSSLIESAMSRLKAQAPNANAASGPAPQREGLGRRDYDLALAERLDQLQSALGESSSSAPPAPATTAPLVAARARTFQPATLLATALFSAVAGAGAMWLAISGNPPMAEPQARIISPAPVTAPAVPAPVAEAAPVAPTPPAKSHEDQGRERLEAWRQAWSSRDSEAYLSHYSPDFAPADGLKRADWAAARRKNLASRTDISVQIRDLHIERLADNQMKLVFLQDYASGKYRENAQPKTLLLVLQDARWLIVGEWQGGAQNLAPSK